MTREIEPPIPEHAHVFEWEDDGERYETRMVGVRCKFRYKIPPGPRGKRPRQRRCYEFMDMDAVLEILNAAKTVGVEAL